MELTYSVRGGDGKEYGPVRLGQITNWVREGRLTPTQEVKRSDMEHWSAAGSFAELQPLFAPPASPDAAGPSAAPGPAAQRIGQADPLAYAQMRSGASWFYWIAGLSLINSISSFTGSRFQFIFGLGTTRILDAMARQMGDSGRVVALFLDVLAAGLFVLFGLFAHKAQTWAFIAGIILFALDSLLLLPVQNWLGLALHAFALFCLFRGFVGCRKLKTSPRP